MKTLIKIGFNVTLMIFTLIIIHTVSVTQAQACSPAFFNIQYPEENATDVPINARIILVSLLYDADSEDISVSIKDDDGNLVDGELIDSNDYGSRGGIFNSDALIFQPSSNLNPRTTYTFTFEEYGYDSATLTFTTSDTEDTEAPVLTSLGIDNVEYYDGDPGFSCYTGDKNIIYFERNDESIVDVDSSLVFLQVYMADSLDEINWDVPSNIGRQNSTGVSRSNTTVGSYVMAIRAMDPVGNISCTYYANFETLDGTGSSVVEIDEDFILLEDCGGKLAGTPITTNGTIIVDPPTPKGPAADSSSGCQLNVASATGSSNLMFYCMIVLFTMICLMRRKGYKLENWGK